MSAKAHESSTNRGFPSSSFTYTPLRHLRVLFVSFIKGLFNAAPAGCFHWEPDNDVSEIFIAGENTLSQDSIGARPAISVTRGPVSFYGLGIDDMEFFDFRNERKTKNVLIPGTVSINCCSKSDLESEEIAWIVAEHIWLLRELFMKRGFFDIGRPSIGAPSAAGSIVAGDNGREWYVTPVSIPFQFYRQSAFTPLGQQIARSIELAVNTSAEQAAHFTEGLPGLAVPGQAHEWPINERRMFPGSFAPDASDIYGRTPDPGGTKPEDALPKVPHPLNPSVLVTRRFLRPARPGTRH